MTRVTEDKFYDYISFSRIAIYGFGHDMLSFRCVSIWEFQGRFGISFFFFFEMVDSILTVT